ncbi:hypothetical protein O6H91_02G075100 [Diphasiastrum complanatum]|uniref:Uncharacterized protein n=1 Tax=Diphasiastrum complanatum TaxID=34168 RepID=A0ACC2EH04_DIPCM|nr:hypothetical protein O6H91_02G075100 [Diphasiastrum complanatum]
MQKKTRSDGTFTSSKIGATTIQLIHNSYPSSNNAMRGGRRSQSVLQPASIPSIQWFPRSKDCKPPTLSQQPRRLQSDPKSLTDHHVRIPEKLEAFTEGLNRIRRISIPD